MTLNMFLESFFLDVIEKRRKAAWLLPMLRGSSFFYRSAIAMRNVAYDRGWLRSQQASLPVVSIGNIVTGGTGKTPLVHKLAEELSKKGKVAILTRGFRSEIEKTDQFLRLNHQEGLSFKAAQCGDEPLLLSRFLPKVDIWVGKNRLQTAEEARAKGVGILILDDGMQYRRLKRDFELVVLDGKDPFGQGYFLPRGLLRDSPKRLKSADLIFFNHVEDEEHFESLQKMIHPFSQAPVVGAQLNPQNRLQLLQKKVGVFCGLGKPQRFFEALKKMQIEVVASLILPDHISPKEEELRAFANISQLKGAECLVCTEKDQIKLSSQLELSLPVIPVKAALEIAFGKKDWEKTLENIQSLLLTTDSQSIMR